ncbi:exodeoxyribonuclease VII small subunit [Kaarinaea lacus]
MAAKKKKKTSDFEATLAELETLVDEMEHGDISLEDSLKKFERGIELTRTCQKALQDAEQKVRMLVEKKQADSLVDVETDEDNQD